MRDDLSHIRDQRAERRAQILQQHKQNLADLYNKYPELGRLARDIESIRREIAGKVLGHMQGGSLEQDVVELEQKLAQLRSERAELLSRYQLNPDVLEPAWECKKCQDTGRVYIDDETIRDCECARAGRLTFRQQSVGLPVRLASASFEQVDFQLYPDKFRKQAQQVFGIVEQYCLTQDKALNGKGLFIHGGTGAGKSFLLGCIANRLVQTLTVKYMVYADFLDTLRSSFGTRDTGLEQDLVSMVNNVDLLLLDDLGVEKPTEFALKSLAQIIDFRYRNCKPVVVTSNFTLEELKNRTQNDLYGERIVWRLIETCNILNLEGNIRLNL